MVSVGVPSCFSLSFSLRGRKAAIAEKDVCIMYDTWSAAKRSDVVLELGFLHGRDVLDCTACGQ